MNPVCGMKQYREVQSLRSLGQTDRHKRMCLDQYSGRPEHLLSLRLSCVTVRLYDSLRCKTKHGLLILVVTALWFMFPRTPSWDAINLPSNKVWHCNLHLKCHLTIIEHFRTFWIWLKVKDTQWPKVYLRIALQLYIVIESDRCTIQFYTIANDVWIEVQ